MPDRKKQILEVVFSVKVGRSKYCLLICSKYGDIVCDIQQNITIKNCSVKLLNQKLLKIQKSLVVICKGGEQSQKQAANIIVLTSCQYLYFATFFSKVAALFV